MSYGILFLYGNFSDGNFLWISFHGWWMSSFIGQNPLACMIEIWMKTHLVNDSNCNIVNLGGPKNLQRLTNNVGLTFSVGINITPNLQLVLIKTTRIDDSKKLLKKTVWRIEITTVMCRNGSQFFLNTYCIEYMLYFFTYFTVFAPNFSSFL